jgi:hypothetical protein
MPIVIKISTIYCTEISALTKVPSLLLYFFFIFANPELGQVSIFMEVSFKGPEAIHQKQSEV